QAGPGAFADGVASAAEMDILHPSTSPMNAMIPIRRCMRCSFNCPDAQGRLHVQLTSASEASNTPHMPRPGMRYPNLGVLLDAWGARPTAPPRHTTGDRRRWVPQA